MDKQIEERLKQIENNQQFILEVLSEFFDWRPPIKKVTPNEDDGQSSAECAIQGILATKISRTEKDRFSFHQSHGGLTCDWSK